MNVKVMYVNEDGAEAIAFAGGEKDRLSAPSIEMTDEQMKGFLPEDKFLYYMKRKGFSESFLDAIQTFAPLLSLFSEDEPLLLYTSQRVYPDTSNEIYLKYGKGKRPDLNKIPNVGDCMNNYDGDIRKEIKKAEKFMEFMFVEQVYKFDYCKGALADNRGNFTWDRYRKFSFIPNAQPNALICNRYLVQSDDDYINPYMSKKKYFHSDSLTFVYLLASQPAEMFSQERVDFYRQQIREGKTLGCIVYKVEYLSNFAIILDGHHRALACMLEGTLPDCLMITRIPSYYYHISEENGKSFLNLTSSYDQKERGLDMPELTEEMVAILNKKQTEPEPIPEDRAFKYYKHYCNKGKNGKTKFPQEYEIVSSKMMKVIKDFLNPVYFFYDN